MLAIAVAAFAGSIATAGNAKPAYPQQLHGIWFDDDSAGFAQCRAYLEADKSDQDELSRHLVGAMVISRSMMHAYAEYGEGNFYELRKLEKQSRNSWRARVAVGIDTMPENSQPADKTFTLHIRGSKLTIASKPARLDLGDSWQFYYKLYRCADLPKRL